MKIKNGELMQYLYGLSSITSKISPKANYNISRNKKMLEEEARQYNEEITKLQKEHCVLDENGELLIHDGNKVDFINGEHQQAMNEAVRGINQSDCELSIRMISIHDIPEAITQGEMDNLLFMINDEDEPII